MTIEVPPNLIGRVEAFVAEVVGKETDPTEVAALRKIALETLVLRGLRYSHELNQPKGDRRR